MPPGLGCEMLVLRVFLKSLSLKDSAFCFESNSRTFSVFHVIVYFIIGMIRELVPK